MNSNEIKRQHRKVYEQFFLENNVVLSAPFVINRSGDVLNNYSGVSIKQKIPLRIYMGYTRTSGSKVKLNKISYLDTNDQSFIQTNILEYAPYFTDLQKEIQKQYGHIAENSWGVEINILSELPRGVGLGFGSIIPLLLSILLNRLGGTINPGDILTAKQSNINDLLQNTTSVFAKIFEDALTLDKHMYNMLSSGTKLASFFDAHYPVVSFSEDFDKNAPYAHITSNRFFWFRMNDLFTDLGDVPYSPIDYGILYSGKPVLLEQIAGEQYNNNSLTAKDIVDEFSWLFGDHLEQLPLNTRPKFYKHLVGAPIDEFSLTYGKLMGTISLKILLFMSKMYRNGYAEDNVHGLLDSLRKFRQGDCVTRHSSYTFLRFIKVIIKSFPGSHINLALSPNDSTIMWWCLLFAMPLEEFRKSILDAFEHTQQEFTEAKFLYANWIDGIESEGVRVEQDLKADVYSEFLESSNCVMRRTSGKVVIADCDDSIANHQSGLLLDTLHNKIYINWEKLTSQDLHSQSATIEIIKMLMQHLWEEVHNKVLPMSSYSKNKNEMVSKIVIPILELVERKLHKKLPLICKGSLYDFYMKLNKSDIEIAIISRLIREEFL